MCGIVASSSSKKFDKDKIAILFLYNQSRGEDSCGYYNHNESIPDFKARVTKAVGKVSDKVLTRNNITPTNLFLGHVRKKSHGIVNLENAHPFVFDHIAGVHNGTLTNQFLLKKEYDLPEYNVDSEVLFSYLSRFDDYTILKEYNGAANVAWVDHRNPGTLFVFKDPKRPLFRGIIKEGKDRTMYISSLEEALKAIGCSDIKAFKDSVLYNIKDGVVADHRKIKNEPRTKLSEKRDLELNPPKAIEEAKPNPNVNVKLDIKNKTFNTPRIEKTVIERTNSGLEFYKQTFSDKTEYVYKKDPVGKVTVFKTETTYCPKRNFLLTTIYFTDGGFKEIRLGIPGYHYKVADGAKLKPLISTYKEESKEKENVLNDEFNFASKVSNNITEALSGLRSTVLNAKIDEKVMEDIEESIKLFDKTNDLIEAELVEIFEEYGTK